MKYQHQVAVTCVVFVLIINNVQGDDLSLSPSPQHIEIFGNLTDKQIPALNLYHFGQKSYYIGDVFKGNFFKSEQFCRFHGMNLVTINSKEENDFLEKKIIERGDGLNHFWISATRLPDVNEWVWFTTGRHITFFNWNAGEPNNAKKDELCVEMRQVDKKLKWNDIDCWRDFNFICEFTWTKDCIKLLKDIQHRPNISDRIDVRENFPEVN